MTASTKLPLILKTLRTRHNLTQVEVGQAVGITGPAYARWERGETEPSMEALAMLATLYHVRVNVFFGEHFEQRDLEAGESYPAGPIILLPVYEEAAAGSPRMVSERPIDRRAIEASREQGNVNEYVLVRVAGDSMIMDSIKPGCLVLIHLQEMVEDGQIALLRLRDDGETIKRVRYLDGGSRVMLIPSNPQMHEEVYPSGDVFIVGRVLQAIVDF